METSQRPTNCRQRDQLRVEPSGRCSTQHREEQREQLKLYSLGGGVGVKASATMAEVEKPGRFRRIQMVVMWDLYYGLHEEESAPAGVTSAL